MFLHHLQLQGFRNYHHQEITFTAQKTILVGSNAQGKSNLLEAVEFMSTLKSHRTSRDRDLVGNDHEQAQIQGQIQKQYGDLDLKVLLRQKGRRSLTVNGETVRRHYEFLGLLNVVEFSCLDLDLVRGSPEVRRHWLDGLVVQVEPVYAYILQQYQKILRQRNALLKRMGKLVAEGLAIAPELTAELTLWTQQLAAEGSRVTRRRARILQRLAPLAAHWHEKISGDRERLNLQYSPHIPWQEDDPAAVQQAFLQKIADRQQAEKFQGKTMVGPHRDDVELAINDTPARFYGSQGQQRTLVLALKLAELDLIEEVVGEPPLLLLDDVLAELDLDRQNQLLNTIQDRFQTLITTTHLNSFDDQWRRQSQILTVQGGAIGPA